jgi:hypothetical protein
VLFRDTRAFEIGKSFEILLLSTMGQPPAPQKLAMVEMNDKIVRAKKKATVLSPAIQLIEEGISYDELFV